MKADRHSEEELKNVLKSLFAEKKRIKEQQKTLEESSIQKKLQIVLSEDTQKLKQKLQEKEEEVLLYQSQLEKIKPALKKLVSDLNQAKEEAELLRGEKNLPDLAMQKTIERMQVEQLKYEEEKKTYALREEELALALVKEQKETARIESERVRLVERLAENLSHVQRQTEMIQELREELSKERKQVESYTKEHQFYVEQLEELRAKCIHAKEEQQLFQDRWQQAVALHEQEKNLFLMESQELSKLRTLLQEAQTQLEKSDLNAIKEEYESRLKEQQEAYQSIWLVSNEKDLEIRKAQQHLAKKVKETTILRDLTDRQKLQLSDQQMLLHKQKAELENLQNHMNLQKIHEEKIQLMAKERTQSAELQTKEWQEKYLSLQKEWQDLKEQMIDLQKIRKSHEQMSTTFSTLKTLIGKMSEESEGE